MKRVGILILGIIDIIACVSLLVWHFLFILGWGALDAFTWGLPIFVAAITALISGIYTLKRKSWGWAVAGLIFVVAGGAYAFIISYATAF